MPKQHRQRPPHHTNWLPSLKRCRPVKASRAETIGKMLYTVDHPTCRCESSSPPLEMRPKQSTQAHLQGCLSKAPAKSLQSAPYITGREPTSWQLSAFHTRYLRVGPRSQSFKGQSCLTCFLKFASAAPSFFGSWYRLASGMKPSSAIIVASSKNKQP